MRVIKSLNNNMVLVEDQTGQTRICQGKGIGFQKKPGDDINKNLVERSFVLESEDERFRFQRLFTEIPDEFWKLAEDIRNYGRSQFDLHVSDKTLLPLCDHLAGSVNRYRNGIQLANPMLWDIKRIYPKEYKVGQYAIEQIRERFDIDMKEDEAAFIAYHFVYGQLDQSGPNASPNNMTSLIRIIIDQIQQDFQIVMDEEDWNYQNFLTYLKFLANRILEGQPYDGSDDPEIFEELITLYPEVFSCVQRISAFIQDGFSFAICQEDQMDMMIYIERLTRFYKKKKR